MLVCLSLMSWNLLGSGLGWLCVGGVYQVLSRGAASHPCVIPLHLCYSTGTDGRPAHRPVWWWLLNQSINATRHRDGVASSLSLYLDDAAALGALLLRPLLLGCLLLRRGAHEGRDSKPC